MFKSSIIPLYKDFPIHQLSLMDFGSADGDRDELIEDVFVRTESVEKFLQGQHSIIIGSIGSGKSALFSLLKKSSRKLNINNNHIVVPIEEMISFQTLNCYINEYMSKFDKKHLYQVFWKFYITAYICREICSGVKPVSLSNFDKKQLNDFLAQINFRGVHENIVEKFFNVLNIPRITIRATVLSTPINVSVDNNKKDRNNDYIDLDNIIRICDTILSENNLSCIVIVDNIDKLISVEEYDMQCSLVEGLLRVEDDIRRMKKIECRIFLRSDIFDRIDFSGLGFDKINDNTLELKWSDDEIICFLARRIMYALGKFQLITYYDVIMTTNLSGFKIDRFFLNKYLPRCLSKFLFNEKEFIFTERERDTGLIPYINKAIVTKLFPRKIDHTDKSGKQEKIDFFVFIKTHLENGKGMITPRFLLTFLKEVQAQTIRYYKDNPDQKPESIEIDGNIEWTLFQKKCVYKAYLSTTTICIKTIEKIESRWSPLFKDFLSRKGTKMKFDFKWFKNKFPDKNEEDIEYFMLFLHVIGFFKIASDNSDYKLKLYEIPIVYSHSYGNNT